MTSYGKEETDQLRTNLESQLERLVEQLHDLEQCKHELDADEYEETKEDTIEQLKELHRSFTKLINGDMTLTSSLESMQMATMAAILQVVKLYSKRDPKLLREHLEYIEQSVKLNKLSCDASDKQKAEILTALKQHGDQLSPKELQFLENYTESLTALENVEFVAIDDS